MTSLLLAIQFLTVFPLKIRDVNERKLANSLIYFPLTGLLIGLALAGLSIALSALYFNEFTVAVMIVVALAIITGGMHLDGLADTFDGLMSGKSREKFLEIMRDSRIGAMGVIGLICVILLKIAFFYSLAPAFKTSGLILMCVLSRWAMVFSIFYFPYARQEGKAKVYMQGVNQKIFLWASGISLLIIFFSAQFKGMIIWLIITAAAYLINRFIKEKIDGLTGDTLGALCEIIEVMVLFSLTLLNYKI